jgi:hypothetical protein
VHLLIKGTVSRDFLPLIDFSPQIILLGSLIIILKYIRILFRFHQNIREYVPTPRYTAWRRVDFVIEYLREYESVFETASACEPGDPGVLPAEKNECLRSHDTVP